MVILPFPKVMKKQDKGQERTLRMVHHILRVHFRNQKAAVIGPDVSHRRNLVFNEVRRQKRKPTTSADAMEGTKNNTWK